MNVNSVPCQLKKSKLVIFRFLFVEILFMNNLELVPRVPSTDQFNIIKQLFILDVAKIQSFFLSFLIIVNYQMLNC